MVRVDEAPRKRLSILGAVVIVIFAGAASGCSALLGVEELKYLADDAGTPGSIDAAFVDAALCAGVLADGHCYFQVSQEKPWLEAEADCVSRGGHLASIADSIENGILATAATDSAWIGLGEGQFAWTDGTTASGEGWRISQSGDGASCGKLALDLLWDEASCDSLSAYLCEIVQVNEETKLCESERSLRQQPRFSVSGSAVLDALQPPFTLEAWVQRIPGEAFAGLVGSRYQVPSSPANHRMELRIEDPGDLYFQYFAGGDTYASLADVGVTAALGWHHFAVSCTTTTCALFRNGELRTSIGIADGTAPGFQGLWVFGTNPTGGQYMRMPLDEVRLSKVARYTDDFVPRRRFVPDADTLGLWHLDETEGTQIFDASLAGNHGLLINGEWGESECSYCLDGIDQDSDGSTDCDDADCARESVCAL